VGDTLVKMFCPAEVLLH